MPTTPRSRSSATPSTPEAEVQMVAPNGTVILGEENYQDTATLYVTFDLAGAAAAHGLYDVVVTNPDAQSVTEYDSVTVTDTRSPAFSASLSMPGVTRPGRVNRLSYRLHKHRKRRRSRSDPNPRKRRSRHRLEPAMARRLDRGS